jgi:hypothetical protein
VLNKRRVLNACSLDPELAISRIGPVVATLVNVEELCIVAAHHTRGIAELPHIATSQDSEALALPRLRPFQVGLPIAVDDKR